MQRIIAMWAMTQKGWKTYWFRFERLMTSQPEQNILLAILTIVVFFVALAVFALVGVFMDAHFPGWDVGWHW